MPTIDAVLFDLYDTLVWSDWLGWQGRLAEALDTSRDEVGRAFSMTRPARSTGAYADADADLAAVVQALGRDPEHGLIVRLRALEHDWMARRVRLYDDSLPTARELRARGVRTAVVSNCSHNTRDLVARLGLAEEFDAVILSVDEGVMKPDPAIYRIALERVGSPAADHVAFVDDQASYCDGATVAGMWTYLILRPEESGEGPPADSDGYRVIHDLAALL